MSRNLAAVMATEGYHHLTSSCPQLQAELLQTLATLGTAPTVEQRAGHRSTVRTREHGGEEDGRRVRPRRE